MSSQRAIAISAEALKKAARSHKQASRYHRDRAREAMQKLHELEEIAARFGIKLDIQTAKGETHGQKTNP